jgi:hypothetical protein
MELNDQPAVFSMGLAPAPRPMLLLRPLLVAATAAGACACANLPDARVLGPPPIAADSPVAQEVQRASAIDGPFPQFRDIPLPPTDVRPVSAWSRSIYDVLRLRRQLIVEAALAGPAPSDTEAFFRESKARATPPASPSATAAAQLQNQTGAFVAGVRQRATPPSSAR